MASVDEFASIVIIKVKTAGGFPAMDLNGKADPFVNIKFGTKKFQTKTIKKTLNPVWDQTFQLFVDLNETKFDFEFELWDWDSVSTNDLIGTTELNFSRVISLSALNQTLPEVTLELTPSKVVKKKNKTPFLTIEIARFDEKEVSNIFWTGLLEWFDTNGNGSINQAEFLSLLYGIEAPIVNSGDDIDTLFRQMDKNGDGELSIEEIVEYFHQQKSDLLVKVWPKAQYMWLVVLRAIQASSSVGNIIMDPQFQINDEEVKYSDQSKKSDDIIIFNRETGKLEVEKIPNYIRLSLKLMYGVGKNVTSNKKIRKILSTMTHKQGATYSDPKSVAQIKPFIAFHGLNMEEAIISDPSQYVHFNDFFYRKLKESARPIAGVEDERAVLTPGDCRLLTFPTITSSTDIWIKAENFNLEKLLLSADDAKLFDGGSLVICRLAPQDYHRFHMPVDGTFNEFREVPGSYFTVNPVAINSTVDVYSTNHRLVTLIDNPRFGKVAFIAVGATLVGSIQMTIKPGDKLKKGDEVGYFAFGGSTVLLLFPPSAITFDADLLVNSAKPLETLVKMGNHIGTFNG